MANEDESFYVPQDITVSILERLPVKSLLRFRCVCKDWNDLLKTSSFIKQHFHRSSPSLLVEYHCYDSFSTTQFSLLDSNKSHLPFNSHSIHRHLFGNAPRIIGSSNGLICLQLDFKRDRSLFLWNPATREVQRVPDSTNAFEHVYSSTNAFEQVYSFGFGFSRVVNDYKIVKIYSPQGKIRVEIYSLSTKIWKEVVELGNLESTGFFRFKEPFTVFDQAMYFFAYTNPRNVRYIVSFDMVKEVFSLIPTPFFLDNKELTTYENKLALLSHYELWVMEEEEEKATSGVSKQRWNKEFISCLDSIILGLATIYPVTIWRDELVFVGHMPKTPGANPEYSRANPKKCISILNLTACKVKEFLISTKHGYVYSAFNYAESLVSIGNQFKNIYDPQ